MKRIIDKTFIKFIGVGIINTVFGTSIMFISYNLLQFIYWVSSAANYILGSILSYFLNKYFTFQNKEKSVKLVLKFILNITICYLIAYGVAKPVVKFLLHNMSKNVQENCAMLCGMGLFVILNYLGQRFGVFKEK